VDKLVTGVAVVLFALGAAWWTAAAPVPATADPAVRPGNRLVRSVGDGFTVQHWPLTPRCQQGPGLRHAGQNNPWERC
jgi:hypothetical protein